MKEILIFLSLLLVLVVSDHSGTFLVKGWYRTKVKGRKIPVYDVAFLAENIVPKSSYLQLGGRIPSLFEGSVRNLGTNILKLDFCGITHVSPGAFLNLPNLEILTLADNDIDHIREGIFNRMNLTSLYLQRNQIISIEPKSFDDMPKLYKLKLNSNKISVWEPDWFHNSPALTEILFRRNEFNSMPNNAFKNVRGGHSYNGIYVVDTKIYLSKNNISEIAPDAFKGLKELSQLWLDRNSLRKIDEKIFSGFTELNTLFLSKNRLSSLPSNMFLKLSSPISVLDLAGNKNLTCLPYSIVSAVNMTNLQKIGRLDCKCVHDLTQRLAQEKKVSEVNTDC